MKANNAPNGRKIIKKNRKTIIIKLVILIYTILKLGCGRSAVSGCFSHLQIYTILKPIRTFSLEDWCFSNLQIYTILKQVDQDISESISFSNLQIYTILKRKIWNAYPADLFQ